jgi:hypothetical protein
MVPKNLLAWTTALSLVLGSVGASRAETAKHGRSFTLLVDSQNKVSSDGYAPRLIMSVSRATPISMMDANCYAYLDGKDKYAEGYCGPVLQVTEGLRIGMGFGFEISDAKYPIRIAYTVQYRRKNLTVDGILEANTESLWHLARITYRAHKLLEVGLMSQRHDGEGPYVALVWNRLSFYAAPLYNIERHATQKNGFHYSNLTGIFGASYAY